MVMNAGQVVDLNRKVPEVEREGLELLGVGALHGSLELILMK